MGCFKSIVKCGAVLTVLVAVLIGCIIAGVPTQLGFYKWIAHYNPENPAWIGMSPSFHDGVAWKYTWDDFSAVDLTGQTALVTGANAGVGYAMAIELAKQGATLVMACRTMRKCDKAAATITAVTGNAKVSTMHMDTSSLASVRAFASAFTPEVLDMLFLNAGIGTGGDYTKDGVLPLSEDGVEMVFATNHLGHHLLSKLLMPKLRAAPTARIVCTSSTASYDTVDWGVSLDLKTLNEKVPLMKTYQQSKFAQILFAQELTRQLGPESTIFVNSFHPGAAASEIWEKNELIPEWARVLFIRKLMREFMWTCKDGGLTGLYLGVAAQTEGIRGKYFHPQSYEVAPHKFARDSNALELQKGLWTFSDELTKDFA